MFLSKNKQRLTLTFLAPGEFRPLSKAQPPRLRLTRPDFHCLSQGTKKEKPSGLMEIPESESRRVTLTHSLKPGVRNKTTYIHLCNYRINFK